MFFVFYDLSLFISARAFLPSLRVLKTNHDKDEIIKMENTIRDIKVELILLVNLLNSFRIYNLKLFKR